MAQLSNNPWSFVPSDPAIATITGATGLTLNADTSVSITTTGALTFNATADSNLAFTVIGAANPLYNGFYVRTAGASGATAFTMQPQFIIPVGTAQSGGGTLIQVLYRHRVRVEDISWQNVVLASQSLDLRDRNGNIIWQASTSASVPASNSQNRGKLFWVSGIAPNVIQSGIVIVTVN
jgi:hypothetical protein